MFGINLLVPSFNPLNLVAKGVTKVSAAILPEKMASLISEIAQMRAETEEIRNKLMDPIRGPIIPFCTKGYTFDVDRIMFCTQVVTDIIEIAAGGVGLGSLASTIISSPEQSYGFFNEAFIPVLDEMAKDGHTTYKRNIDRALTTLINLDTTMLKRISYEEFKTHISGDDIQRVLITQSSPSTNDMYTQCTCTCQDQIGGTYGHRHLGGSRYTASQLRDISKRLGLPATGNKRRIADRISYLLM
jgi:hypothetical protein